MQATIDIAQSIGKVIDIPALLPRSGIHTVQSLAPRQAHNSERYGYSKSFGLGKFPMHTDLAHWNRPPRFILLRCISGSRTVGTLLLPASAIESRVDATVLNKALARPRRPGKSESLLPFPLMFGCHPAKGFRWDSLFLVPINKAASQIAEVMSANYWDESTTVPLSDVGDTLIVDNWRCLHGRSAVDPNDISRNIERVYLSAIHP